MDIKVSFPNMVEKPKGFYDIPDNDLVWIAMDGRCVNKRTGHPIKVQTLPHGYKAVMVNVKGKTFNFYHHRLLARAFLERPTRHADRSYDKLEVNHIDGNGENNVLENLEWLTPEENLEHSIALGLRAFPVVWARNIRTNEITRFLNASACAREFKISFRRLQRHLRSKLAGYVTKDWHVFQLQRDHWPQLRPEHRQESTWDKHFGVWVATAVEIEDKILVADTLAQICDELGWHYGAAQTFLNRNPEGKTYLGWVVVYDDLSISRATERVRNFKDRTLFPPKDVVVTNLLNNEECRYASRNLAASALGIHPDRIRYALKAKDGVVDNYRVVEV